MGDGTTLRERKRLAAMRRIQREAVLLFDAHGYPQVSVERIAAAAEVSPSSVYRYFGTKEHILLWDEYDGPALVRFAELIAAHPPVTALRRACTEILETLFEDDSWHDRRRMSYILEEPALQAASAGYAHEVATALAGMLADQLGRPPDDVDVYLFAHATVGAILAALRYWHESDYQRPLADILDRVFTSLEHGFKLS